MNGLLKILALISTLSSGCSVYKSQGRKDFEDSRDFQITVAALNKNNIQTQITLDCQIYKNESSQDIKDPRMDCGLNQLQNQQTVFHKQLSSNQLQLCQPTDQYTDLTFDQLSFFKEPYCELEK